MSKSPPSALKSRKPTAKNVKQNQPCLFSNAEYQARQDRVRGWLARHSLSGCLLTSPPTLAYLSGFDTLSRSAGLVLTQRQAQLILPPEETARARRQSLPVPVIGTTENSPLLLTAQKLIEGKRVAIECDDVSVTLRKAMQDVFVGTELVDMSEYLLRLRAQKSFEERQLLSQLNSLAEKTLSAAEKALAKTKTAQAIANQMHKQMQQEVLKNWPTQPLAGMDATVLVAQNGDGYYNPQQAQAIGKSDAVVLTAAPHLGTYVCPRTRTVLQSPVNAQARIFVQKCEELLARAKQILRPGLSGDEIATALHAQAKSQGIKLNEETCFGQTLDLSACRGEPPYLVKLSKTCTEKLQEDMVVILQLLLPFPPKTSVSGFFQSQQLLIIGEEGASTLAQLSAPENSKKRPAQKNR